MLLTIFLWLAAIVVQSECKSPSISVSFHNVTQPTLLPTYSNFSNCYGIGDPYLTIYKDLLSSINYIWYTQTTGNNFYNTYKFPIISNIYDMYGEQYNGSNKIKSDLPITLISDEPDGADVFTATSPETNDIIICYDDLQNYTYKCQIYLNEKQIMLASQPVTDNDEYMIQVLCMADAYIIFWTSYYFFNDEDCRDICIMYDLWDLNGNVIQNDVLLINISNYFHDQGCPDPYGWKITAKDKNFVIEFEALNQMELGQTQYTTIEFISGFYTNLTDSLPLRYRLITPLSNTYVTTDTQYDILDVVALNISSECCIISLYNNATIDAEYYQRLTFMTISDIFGRDMFEEDGDIFITNLTSSWPPIRILPLSEIIPSLFGVIYPNINEDTQDYKLFVQVYQLIENKAVNKIGSPQLLIETNCTFSGDYIPQIIFNSNIGNDTSLLITWESGYNQGYSVMVQSWNVSISDESLSSTDTIRKYVA